MPFTSLPRQKIYKLHYIDFIIDVIKGNFNSNKSIKDLEDKLVHYLNTKYVKLLFRGRLGIYLAVKSIIDNNKNEIIMSPYTIFDVVNMVICAGGKPVFIDIDLDHFSPNLNEINKYYNNKTAAILVTHMHKSVKNLFEINEFCKQKNIKLIEDAAIAFGASLNKKKLGTIGNIGIYSFSMFKFVSSFNGGAIVTQDSDIYKKILDELSTFKKSTPINFIKKFIYGLLIDIVTINFIFQFFTSPIFRFGFLNKIRIINNFTKNDPNPFFLKKLPDNYKLLISNHQAKSIDKQLKNVKYNYSIRKSFFKTYYEELKDIDEIMIPTYNENYSDPYINFPILYNKRNELLKFLFLNKRDIGFYFYRNCNEINFFKDYFNSKIINIKKINEQLIILPTYSRYSYTNVKKNIDLIKLFFNKKN